jgi:hypothetical protein
VRFYTTTRLSENIHETPEGFLVCVGVPIARTGEMVYGPGETPIESGPDGTVIITRSADEVFSPKTIASFEGKSFTVWHPGDFINPRNWRELTKGLLFHVRRGTGENENDLLSDILVTDIDAIEKVKAGMREVSLGYDAEYVQTGIGRGIQKNILGNHCALVDEGRAGAAYAINDHKGKGSTMKLRDRVKSIFGKAQDDAMKLVDEAEKTGVTVEEDDDEKEDIKSLAKTIDGLSRVVVKLNDKVDRVAKRKTGDTATPPTQNQPGTAVAKDDEGEGGMAALTARLVKLEALVSKLAEKMSMGADEEYGGDDDEVADEEACDEDGDDDDEVTDGDDDDDSKKKKMTGDRKAKRKGPGDEDEDEDSDDDEEELAARVEILAPGMNARVKDAKRKALIAAYQTKDGKKVIERFTGGRKPNFNDKSFVQTVFVGAAEILASDRTDSFSRSKTSDGRGTKDPASFGLSPDEVNKRNEAHYASKTTH